MIEAAPTLGEKLLYTPKAAHRTCPYSKATRGNIDVAINVI
jgi:organic hydroperoxide reductase OsmC/OhrA